MPILIEVGEREDDPEKESDPRLSSSRPITRGCTCKSDSAEDDGQDRDYTDEREEDGGNSENETREGHRVAFGSTPRRGGRRRTEVKAACLTEVVLLANHRAAAITCPAVAVLFAHGFWLGLLFGTAVATVLVGFVDVA
jgi:hypothetical protein